MVYILDILGFLSNSISVATPVVLLAWFFFSEYQRHKRSYYNTVDGIYANYISPTVEPQNNGSIYAGLIMSIKNTDDNGYFLGEFQHSEVESYWSTSDQGRKLMSEGIFIISGNMKFQSYRTKHRSPFKLSDNRVYKGKLYIVDKIDFEGEQQLFDFVKLEYDVIHYRERQSLEFTLVKEHEALGYNLPEKFILHKTVGIRFEPFTTLKNDIFGRLLIESKPA